jgi:hypothetical protein
VSPYREDFVDLIITKNKCGQTRRVRVKVAPSQKNQKVCAVRIIQRRSVRSPKIQTLRGALIHHVGKQVSLKVFVETITHNSDF